MSADPFLRWAGGKRRLLPQIRPFLPSQLNGARYFEPFLGGGSVFFAIAPHHATLSDANQELMETYECVKNDVGQLIERLRGMNHTEGDYYRIRAQKPRTRVTRAARFIYLNKTCFNGLYRVNLSGDFNVPFGRHPNVRICDESQLRDASRLLSTAHLLNGDFEDIVSEAGPGDWVYFDPPYTVSHRDNGFVEYNAQIFSWSDQRRLAALALRLVQQGVNCVITNAEHQSIRDLYRNGQFCIHELSRWSTVAASSQRRFSTTELLLVGDPKVGAG